MKWYYYIITLALAIAGYSFVSPLNTEALSEVVGVAKTTKELKKDKFDNILLTSKIDTENKKNNLTHDELVELKSYAIVQKTNLAIPTQLDGYTMTAIRCYVVSGTSKAIIITDGTNATESITCGTTITSDDGSIANAGVTAAELMYIDFGSTSGAVDYVSISVFGNWSRE